MTRLRIFIAITIAGFFLAAATLRAQTITSTQRITSGRILLPDPSVAPIDPIDSTALFKPPDRPERYLPPEVKALLRRFEAARQQYLQREAELKRKLQGATTDQERQAIRERLKDSLRQWREQERLHRDEIRQRLREIRSQTSKLGKALEEARPARRPGLD